MSFLDNLGKSFSHGVDRAKFEAEKFQRTNRLNGELNQIKKQLDDKLIELGQRAYDLHRAGQISAPSVAALTQVIDRLRSDVIVKEEALKAVQAESYEEPPAGTAPPAQSVPVNHEPAPPAQQHTPPPPPPAQQRTPPPQPSPQERTPPPPQGATGSKTCPACGFTMPMHAVFCPNCGYRVGK
jgi:outer membrane biosynthesis protein TonB